MECVNWGILGIFEIFDTRDELDAVHKVVLKGDLTLCGGMQRRIAQEVPKKNAEYVHAPEIDRYLKILIN